MTDTERLREALRLLLAYREGYITEHLTCNGCEHGFKPASACPNEGCEDGILQRALDRAALSTPPAAERGEIRPIEITGGEVLPDGRLYASFVWPFERLGVPNNRYALIEAAPTRETEG